MGRNKFSIIIYMIIALAVIGIVSQLFNDPIIFLKDIFMIIGVGVVLFSIVYFILFRNRSHSSSSEMKKYKQAVKQSQQKYKPKHVQQSTKNQQKKSPYSKRKASRRASHLRVIDGNGDKSKQKDRATF